MAADGPPGVPLTPTAPLAPVPLKSLLMRIDQLDPVKDDTGALLSTKERLDATPLYLDDVAMPGAFVGPDHAQFNFTLTLDAPARTATKIPSLKGKLVVSKRKIIPLGFKDLAALDGRPLIHPKLKDFEIRATLKEEDQKTRVTLDLPPRHSRVLLWGLFKDGQMLPMNPVFTQPLGLALPPSIRDEFSLPMPDLTTPTQIKDYPTASTKGAVLGIALAEGVESEELAFEFKDLELP